MEAFVVVFVNPLLTKRTPTIEECELEVDLNVKDLKSLAKIVSDEGIKIPIRHYFYWM